MRRAGGWLLALAAAVPGCGRKAPAPPPPPPVPAGGMTQADWAAVRSNVFRNRDDVEFFRGTMALFESGDADVQFWAVVHLGVWSPVLTRLRGASEDPLEKPEGDPAWERVRSTALGLGLEKEVAENPRGGPRLAAAVREKLSLFAWASGSAAAGSRWEVPLQAFAPGLVLKMEAGPLRTDAVVRVGEVPRVFDAVSLDAVLVAGDGKVLATLSRESLGLPGDVLWEGSITGRERESLHIWMRAVDARDLRWWVLPLRLPRR